MQTQDPEYTKWLSQLDELHSKVNVMGDIESPRYDEPESQQRYDFKKLYDSPHRDQLLSDSRDALGQYAMPDGFEWSQAESPAGMASGVTAQGLPFVSNTADESDQEPKGVSDVWNDFSAASAVPFVAGVHELGHISKVWEASRDLEKNGAGASPENFKLVNDFLQDMQRDRTFLGGVAELVLQLPAFAGEFFTSGGVATATRKGAAKLAGTSIRSLLEKKLGKNIATKGLAAVAGGAAQTNLMTAVMTPRVAAAAYRRALPGMASMQDGERAAIIFDETSKDFMEALPAGYADMWIEVLSEKSGEGIAAGMRKLPLVNKLNIMQGSVFQRWKKMNPTRTTRDFLDGIAKEAGWAKTLDSIGLQGPVTEMLEERVGDVMRTAILGDEWSWPTATQIAQELTAFSAIPAITAIPQRRQQARMLEALEKQADSEEALSQNVQEVFEGKDPVEPVGPVTPVDPTKTKIESLTGKVNGKEAVVEFTDDGFRLTYGDSQVSTSVEVTGHTLEEAVSFAEKHFKFERSSVEPELGGNEPEKDPDIPTRADRELEEEDGEFTVIEDRTDTTPVEEEVPTVEPEPTTEPEPVPEREPNPEGGATAEEVLNSRGEFDEGGAGNITPEEANFGFKTAALEIDALNEAEPEPADRKKQLKLYDALTQAMTRGTRDFQALVDEADSRGFGDEVREAIGAYAEGVSKYREAQGFEVEDLMEGPPSSLPFKPTRKQTEELQALGIKDSAQLTNSTKVIKDGDGEIVAATSGQSLHVHPEFQQMGLATKLLEFMKKRGGMRMVAPTRHAVKFLSDRGFTADGKWVSGEGQAMVFKPRKEGSKSDLSDDLEADAAAESKIDPEVVTRLMDEHDISEESARVSAQAPEGEKAYFTREQITESVSEETLDFWELAYGLEIDEFGYNFEEVASLLESDGYDVPTPSYTGGEVAETFDSTWEADKPPVEEGEVEVDVQEEPSRPVTPSEEESPAKEEVELTTSPADDLNDKRKELRRRMRKLKEELGRGEGSNDSGLQGAPEQGGRLDPEVAKKIMALAEELVALEVYDYGEFVDEFQEYIGEVAVPYLPAAWGFAYKKADKSVQEKMTSPADARKVNIQERSDAKSKVGPRGGEQESVLGGSSDRSADDSVDVQSEAEEEGGSDDRGGERTDLGVDELEPGESSVDDRGADSDGRDGDSADGQSAAELAPDATRENVTASEDRARRLSDLGRGDAARLAKENSKLVDYDPASKGNKNGLKMPARLAAQTHRAVKKIETETGVQIDKWVSERIGAEDATEFLYAEQLDAVALAIFAIENGRGLIIGDQTGTGKGRIAGSVVRYALNQGLAPVWVTEGDDLYKAATRDLADVEIGGVSVTATNNNLDKAMDGSFGQSSLKTGEQKEKLIAATERLIALSPLPADASSEQKKLQSKRLKAILGGDVLLTSYRQVGPGADAEVRRNFMSALAPHAVLVMDESHNAAGGGGAGKPVPVKGQKFKVDKDHTKEYFRRYVGASRGSVFLSATWAKGPKSLGLYTNTPMGIFGAHLGSLIQSGGLPLQQVVTSSLAASGSLIRRQADMGDASFETVTMKGFEDTADTVSDILSSIMSLDGETAKPKKLLAARYTMSLTNIAEMHNSKPGSVSDMDFKRMTPFGSEEEVKPAEQLGLANYLHPVMSTIMLSMKAEEIANETIAAAEAGYKPVIAVQNTGASLLEKHREESDLQDGDEVGEFGVRQALIAQLHRSRTLRVNSAIDPDKVSDLDSKSPKIDIAEFQAYDVYLTDELLRSNNMVNFLSDWEAAKELIEKADLSGMSGSPLDAIIERLEAAKLRVGEATGRKSQVRKGKYGKRKVDSELRAGMIASFNGDRMESAIDVLVVNKSAATGLDMHAGNKFNDRRPRIMLVAQMFDDINVLQQVLGRIDRNNQAHSATYKFLISDVPVEMRYMSMTSKKLAQLNSSATGEEGGEFGLSIDVMNNVGDTVTDAWLRANPVLRARMGLKVKGSGKGRNVVQPDIASKVFLRMALIHAEDQRTLVNDIEENYVSLMEAQAAMGTVITGAQQLDLNAVTNKVSIMIPAAEEGSTDHISGPTYIESVTVDRQFVPKSESAVRDMHNSRRSATSALGQEIEKGRVARLDELSEKSREITEEVNEKVVARIERSRKAHQKAVELAEKGGLDIPDEVVPGPLQSEMDAITAANTSAINAEKSIKFISDFISKVLQSGGYATVSRGGDTVYGQVLGVTDKGTSNNLDSLSRYDVAVYTAESGIIHISGSALQSEFTVVLDQKAIGGFARSLNSSTSSTEERHIITGNLALARLYYGDLGKVIEYTAVEKGEAGGEVEAEATATEPLVRLRDNGNYYVRGVTDMSFSTKTSALDWAHSLGMRDPLRIGRHEVYYRSGEWFIEGFSFAFLTESDAVRFADTGQVTDEAGGVDAGMVAALDDGILQVTVAMTGEAKWKLRFREELFDSWNEAVQFAYKTIQETREGATSDESPQGTKKTILRTGQLLPKSKDGLEFINEMTRVMASMGEVFDQLKDEGSGVYLAAPWHLAKIEYNLTKSADSEGNGAVGVVRIETPSKGMYRSLIYRNLKVLESITRAGDEIEVSFVPGENKDSSDRYSLTGGARVLEDVIKWLGSSGEGLDLRFMMNREGTASNYNQRLRTTTSQEGRVSGMPMEGTARPVKSDRQIEKETPIELEAPIKPKTGFGDENMKPIGDRGSWFDVLGNMGESRYSGDIVSRQEMIEMLAVLYSERRTPIRHGVGLSSYAGFYRPGNHIVRLRNAYEVTTAAHEVGHALQTLFSSDPGPFVPLGQLDPATKAVMMAELKAMGERLYGDVNPQGGGYTSEGFAEFVREYLTRPEDAKRNFPAFHGWFTKKLKADYPDMHRNMQVFKGKLRERLLASPEQRASRDQEFEESKLNKIHIFKEYIGWGRGKEGRIGMRADWLDSNSPLLQIDEYVAKQAREEGHGSHFLNEAGILNPSQSMYRTAAALEQSYAARTAVMADRYTMDINGNPVGEPLSAIRKILKSHEWKDFAIYLWARRALALGNHPDYARDNYSEKTRKSRQGGLEINEALAIVKNLEGNRAERFREAAERVYNWNNDILRYAASASPQLGRVMHYIMKIDPGQYVPLWGIFEQLDASYASGGSTDARSGNVAKRLRGSMNVPQNVLVSMLANAENIVQLTHKRVLLDMMYKYRRVPGIGHLIEEIPADKDSLSTNVHAALSEIARKLGLDEIDGFLMGEDQYELEHADALTAIQFFFPTMKTKDDTVRFTMIDEGGGGPYSSNIKQFELKDPILLKTLLGISPQESKNVILAFVRFHTRLWRMGTVAWRLSFGWVTNPQRDFRTFWIQSRSQGNSAWSGEVLKDMLAMMFAAPFYHAMGTASRERLPKSMQENFLWFDKFMALGGEMQTPVGQDISYNRRSVARIGQNPVQRIMKPGNWLDILAAIVQLPEGAVRVTELKQVAKARGLKPGDKMSADDAIVLNEAMSQVTVNFRRGGERARQVNRYIPFFTATLNAYVDAAGAYKRNPQQFILRSLVSVTIPAIASWFMYRDEEWYVETPANEKFQYNFIRVGDDIIRVRQPHEYGVVFGALVTAMLDSAYREGDNSMDDFARFAKSAMSPEFMPPILQESAEQLANMDWFFDRPIVPRREAGRMYAADQHGPYTTQAAKFLGGMLGWSPRRIDHAVKGFFGSAVPDAQRALESMFTAASRDREFEASDVPLLGATFRRGGATITQSKTIDRLYELKESADLRMNSPSVDETEQQRQRRLLISDATRAIGLLSSLRSAAYDVHDREAYTKEMVAIAKEAANAYSSERYIANDKNYLRQRMRNLRKQAQQRKDRAGL